MKSRYEDLPQASYRDENGDVILYKKRRFLPRGEKMTKFADHVVQEHDRLDRIAYDKYREATFSWRIADANNAMLPEDLVQKIGARLKIAMIFDPRDL